MRLFIAIVLSGEMREAVLQVQTEMKRQRVSGNYTKPENLHLTLAFIGEYPDADEVLEVLETVPFRPFPLRLIGIGAFGDLWWLGLEKSEPLMGYARALRHSLAEAGIPFDSKRFSPHITLLRRASCPGGRMPGIAVPQAAMTVERISLMRSDRGKDGMVYTEL